MVIHKSCSCGSCLVIRLDLNSRNNKYCINCKKETNAENAEEYSPNDINTPYLTCLTKRYAQIILIHTYRLY